MNNNTLVYGLPNQLLAQIITKLEKNQNIDEAVLFGSRAKGTFSNGSDIDIALKGDITLDDILKLSIETDELNLPYKFDFVIFSRIKDKNLIDHIQRVGIVLFNRLNS